MLLIVDDEYSISELIAKFVDHNKFKTICTTSSPQEALDIIDKLPITQVVTDLVMPEMNGVDLIKKIRTKKPDIKILAVSGLADVLNYELISLEVPYITKPFSKEELMKHLG
jgi:YesN/AraC family two-component response regulator